jgi:hypothetical protein
LLFSDLTQCSTRLRLRLLKGFGLSEFYLYCLEEAGSLVPCLCNSGRQPLQLWSGRHWRYCDRLAMATQRDALFLDTIAAIKRAQKRKYEGQ